MSVQNPPNVTLHNGISMCIQCGIRTPYAFGVCHNCYQSARYHMREKTPGKLQSWAAYVLAGEALNKGEMRKIHSNLGQANVAKKLAALGMTAEQLNVAVANGATLVTTPATTMVVPSVVTTPATVTTA